MAHDPEQTNPVVGLRSDRVEAFGLLLEGYQRLVTAVEYDLRTDTGLSLQELEALIHLANEPEEALRPRDLAERCVMTTSGCTRLLDRLEQQGLIERGPHATDRRGLVVRLTPRGRDWLDSILPEHFQSLQTHLWSALEPSEIQTLGQIMRKVRDANS